MNKGLVFVCFSTDESFKQEFLGAHNQYRKQHQAPELTYSDYTERITLKIFVVLYILGKEAVDSWYSEIKDYNFNTPGHQPKTGHFTQVVWKSSTELGVGLATDGNTVYVVGQYKPAGNITNAGYYEQNVLPKTE
uniref:SCP domain-containing protein n=1 Tax=Sinocyclocheilus rhinocerous TaxID=307959 RepID=A0A673NBK4_9TELE